MQLADHDALGAVDDEGGVIGHERDVADVDVLFGDLLHFAALFAVKNAERGFERR